MSTAALKLVITSACVAQTPWPAWVVISAAQAHADSCSSCCRQAELKLVITSATLDGEKFSAYYGNCPVFNIPGRTFPVQISHSKENHTKDYLEVRGQCWVNA